MNSLVSKVAHSIMLRLALIVTGMGLMIGAAVYVSWTVFQAIETEMLTMADDRIPQLRASGAVTAATEETRAFLSSALAATTTAELEALRGEKSDLLARFRELLGSLPEENARSVGDLLDEAEPALHGLLQSRLEEKQATNAALAALDAAFLTANAVSARLEEATDSALFDMTLSAEEASSSMEDTLTTLVERDFAQFQAVLAIQSEVNLLSGLGLAVQAGRSSATRSIIDDLAVSSLERLEATLSLTGGTEELQSVFATVTDARQFFERAFEGGARPPAPGEILAVRLEVDSVLSPAVDDAYFNLIIGSDEAKQTSQTVLAQLMETKVAVMREMAYLDAATKNFFSLALKTALAQSPTELSLAQNDLVAQESIVRSLVAGVTDTDITENIEKLLALADASAGIAASQSAVFAAQTAAAQATENAARAVSAISGETAVFSAASINAIDETARVLSARVDSAGAQIAQIGAFGLLFVLAAPIFVWLLVTRPMNRVTRVTERLAAGDLSEIDGLRAGDGELGRLATALHVFRDNALQTIKMREDEKEREKENREKEKVAEKAKQDAMEAENLRQKHQEEAVQRKTEKARKDMIANLNASIGSVVSAASDGDFSSRVDIEFDDEELTGLAASVNVLVENVEIGLKKTTHVLSRVSAGDLTERMTGEFKGEFASLQADTNGMIEALRTLVADITGSGSNLAASSAELRDTSDSLSRQAEQNAASLEETSAALEQLSASIKQVSHSAADASENARKASSTAQSSGEVAADAAASMTRISEASKEITDAVGVINDIAFQINLLALNAGVEAARAGEAGRGFSVVASEVRQLAQRASEAAKEIDSVIKRSDEAVTEGVAKVGNAQSSLANISESVVNISGRVEDISRAISEQVHGIGEITNAVSQIDQNTQKQAASFEEVTAAGSLLANEAQSLKQSTSRFSTGAHRETTEPNTTVGKANTRPAVKVVNSGYVAPLAGDGWDEF